MKHGDSSDVFSAVINQDAERTAQLLDVDPSLLEATDWMGLTPMLWAVLEGDAEMVKLLLDRGANVNERGSGGKSVLQWAVWEGNREVAELLISRGARVNSKSKDKLLILAARRGMVDIAKMLIDMGADTNTVDELYFTPLHEAANEGHSDVVKLLLSRGVDPNIRSTMGSTPLHHAGSREVAELLIAHGADIDAQDQLRRKPLQRLTNAGAAEVLIAHGADVNEGLPLLTIAQFGNAEFVRLLLDKGANINARSRDGRNALHCAAHGSCGGSSWRSYREIASLLIDRGVDVNARDKWGMTPLDLAVECGGSRMADFLTSRGARTGKKRG